MTQKYVITNIAHNKRRRRYSAKVGWVLFFDGPEPSVDVFR